MIALSSISSQEPLLVLGAVVVLTAWASSASAISPSRPIPTWPTTTCRSSPVAGPLGRGDRAPGHHPGRDQMPAFPTSPTCAPHAGRPVQLMLVFDDDSTSDVNREHVLERLSMVTLPAPGAPDGHRLEPRRPDLLVHLESTNPPTT